MHRSANMGPTSSQSGGCCADAPSQAAARSSRKRPGLAACPAPLVGGGGPPRLESRPVMITPRPFLYLLDFRTAGLDRDHDRYGVRHDPDAELCPLPRRCLHIVVVQPGAG